MIRIPEHLLEHCWDFLLKESPLEGVGFWIGSENLVEEVVLLENRHPEPTKAYSADPQQVLDTLEGCRRTGKTLLAIFHSHPKGSAKPSATDIADAFWQAPSVIFSLTEQEYKAYKLPSLDQVIIQVVPS